MFLMESPTRETNSSFQDNQFVKFIHSIKTGNIDDAKYNFNEEFLKKIDKCGLQPIHWASLNYNTDILKWLLEKKCNIESSSRNGWRPIHFATFAGDEKMVKLLINNYCKLDCQTDKGETISDVANGDCDREFIDEILNETNNLKVALSMRLKCDVNCDHKLCLNSVVRGKFYDGEKIEGASFAKICKVRESQSDRLFAVKMIWKDRYNDTNNTMPKNILPNINRYLTKLNHENIIKYFGMIETPTKWKIFIEWMDKGSMFDEIRSTGSLPDDKIIRYCKDIIQAVAFLHRNEIIHRRINPGNLLIDNNGRCKLLISDLSCLLGDDEIDIPVWSTPSYRLESVSVTPVGCCSLVNDEITSNFCGTQYYIAPEIKNGEPYNYPADIWCVGATVIHMLTGSQPYHGFEIDIESNEIKTNKNLEYTLPRPITNELQQFIEDMIKPEPDDRPIANELLNSELIRNVSIDCEINNSNIDQSIIDYSLIKRQRCKDLIDNAIENHKIGLSMGLKCLDECIHKFCLSSVTATNFKKGKNIGVGAGGEVYKINFNSEMFWAMKIIENVDDENIQEKAKHFENDINRYREYINHENIVKYFGAVRNLKKIFIFMEFVDGESLHQKIKKNKYKPLPLKMIKYYTKQILEGLKFLHEKHIIHRDIKSANILIDKNNIVKIADFGVSRFLRTISKQEQKTFCGTANYLSPEMVANEPYDCSADIWSLGATVFEMATGHPPYHDMDEFAVIFKIGNDKIIEYPPDISDNIKMFLDSMINVEPKNRSSAESLLRCTFLN